MANVTFPASAGRTISSWEHIEAQVLGAAVASISFADIDSAFRMFRMTLYIINDNNACSVLLRLNNDSGGNYDRQQILADHVEITSLRDNSQTSYRVTNGANLGANETLLAAVTIAKQIVGEEARIESRASYGGTNDPFWVNVGGAWQNAADLINRIDIISSSGNFAASTRIVLEGTKRTS